MQGENACILTVHSTQQFATLVRSSPNFIQQKHNVGLQFYTEFQSKKSNKIDHHNEKEKQLPSNIKSQCSILFDTISLSIVNDLKAKPIRVINKLSVMFSIVGNAINLRMNESGLDLGMLFVLVLRLHHEVPKVVALKEKRNGNLPKIP